MAAVGDAEPARGSGRKPLIASLTKYISYPAITHAGGQYLYEHNRALREFAEVVDLAPSTPLNRDALKQADPEPAVSLMTGVGVGGEGRFKTLFDLESAWAGSSVSLPIRRLFRSDRAPWDRLRSADVVEFQWSEMIALAPSVRQRLPRTPLVGIAHDVLTQRWDREAHAAGSVLRRSAYRLAAARSRSRESRSYAPLDLLIAFSEKDAALAKELAPGTRVEVVHPGLGPRQPLERTPDVDAPVVLFTGALNRPDNSRGIGWFLAEMWPAIHDAVPTARLVIAGAHPPSWLQRSVAAAPRAQLTGFVDSLEPWYARATVFIAPLRTGAGVKFKTVDALLRAVPVVTTSVGAEGIDAAHLFAAVEDEPSCFADAVIGQLRRPDDDLAARARAWADGVYGHAAFGARLAELYLPLIETGKRASAGRSGSGGS